MPKKITMVSLVQKEGEDGKKMEANIVSCGASNKSGCSPDLAGQMAGARWPCRRVELSCDLCDPEERGRSVVADWRKGHLVPYLHLLEHTKTPKEAHVL